jgi:hypothetical protein
MSFRMQASLAHEDKIFRVTPRRRKLALGCVALLGAGGVLLAVFCAWVEHAGIAPAPEVASLPAICSTPVREEGGVRRIGPAWSRSHGGVRFTRIAGEPFELGWEASKLQGELPEHLEDVLYKMKDAFVPWRPAQWALRKLLLFEGRDLASYFPLDRRLEILGQARAASRDRHSEDAPLYNRILAYHAVHDIAHKLIDSPFVYGHWDELQAGCTALAACSNATADGHVLLARNFDFEAGRVFDEEKVVIACAPAHGVPFVHVAWSGMVGAVSGLNAEGIACVLDASASEDDASVGEPVSLVVREVLERAHTLDEAIAIVRAAPVFVSDVYVVASGKEGRAVAIEKSPARCAVREAKDGLLLASNHFLAPEFASDAANRSRRQDATTEERLARLAEVTAPLRGKLDPASALSVLRDRRGPSGKDVGLGNRGAIDALIATHSVIIDATDRVLWVSCGPHTLGRYLRVPVDRMLDDPAWTPSDEGALPADPLLASAAEHVELRKKLIGARAALSAGDLERARTLAREASELDPRFFEPEEVLVRIAIRAGDAAGTREHAKAALERWPPFAALRTELEQLAR